MITPYYSDDLVTLYHGRCEDVLPFISGVDLVLTSPPYNLSDGRKPTGSTWKGLENGYASHDDAMPHESYVEQQHLVLGHCWNALSDTGAIYYQHKPLISRGARKFELRTPFELIPTDMPIRQIITWDRGSGFIRTHVHYVPRYEWIIVLARDGFRISTLDVDDLWRIPFETGGEHPAPFPLALASRAINSTHPGLVLDPFAGSGTTLRAAKDAGRPSIGIELSERYCEIAAKRLAQGVLDFGASA